ncbi:hypothetical protein [Streptomyces bullii]|uniref:Uncharacterized protein n=1 Tax=Streptomyces bullii TaxID=349910 RepID=A0ABW0UUC5_9ACTN
MADSTEPSAGDQTSRRLSHHPFFERHMSLLRFLEVAAAIFIAGATLVTLIFLARQTEAARQQAEDTANQVSAARLDGLYQQLLRWDEFRSASDNKRMNLLMTQVDSFDDIKDAEEREQYYSAQVWFVDYFSYVYSTLPGLEECVPDDGRLTLRGSPEDKARKCDTWIAWSQTIHDAFSHGPTCQVLNDFEALYERKFVNAIRKSGACVK